MILFLVFVLFGAFGYYVANLIEDVMLQRTMNKWRRELDLTPKPVTIRFKTALGVQ